MKKLIILLVAFSVLTVSSMAAYEEGSHYLSPDGIPYVEVTVDGELRHMTESEYQEFAAEQEKFKAVSVVTSDSPDQILYDASLVDEGQVYASDLQSNVRAQLTTGLAPSEDSPAGTMKYVVKSIFGEYEPIQEHVTIYLEDGTAVDGSQTVQGIAGVDWAYLSGVALFALCLAALFKLLRVVIGVV